MNKVNPPVNGLIYPTHNGAVAHIYCKSGYLLRGPTEVHCDGRKWDNQMPTCLGKTIYYTYYLVVFDFSKYDKF